MTDRVCQQDTGEEENVGIQFFYKNVLLEFWLYCVDQ